MSKAPNKSVRTAIGYCRVSSEGQRDEGVSLEAQQSRIAAYATAMGYRLEGVHVDGGKSGRSRAGRPGLEKAMAEVCRTKGVLVAVKLDRLARSTRDAIDIAERVNKCGADLASIAESIDTATGMGRFVFRLMASLGELEADQTGERTAGVLRHLRHEGRIYSKLVPFGFERRGDKLVPVDGEQKVARLMAKLAAGGNGYRAIATELNRRGHTRRDGKPWRWESVRAVLSARAREMDTPRRKEPTHAR